MKQGLLLWCIGIWCQTGWAQVVEFDTSTTAPPPVRHLRADPDENRERRQPVFNNSYGRQREVDESPMKRMKETRAFYLSVEGGTRVDGSVLTSSFNNLVSSQSIWRLNGAVLAGFTYRNAWSIETGVAYSPIHMNITIENSPNPLVFNYQNSGWAVPVRLKRRLGLGSRAQNGTGFWLTAGAWLVPNGGEQLEKLRLTGYANRPRGYQVDSLQLNVNTTVTSRITGMAELGIDYTARLGTSVELGFFLRRYWGLGTPIYADLTYVINNSSTRTASQSASGTGWGLGVSLRYVYGRQYAVKLPRF